MYKHFFVFLLICFSAKSQTNHVSLKLMADDKISVHGFSYWQEFTLTSKDTSITYSLHTKNPDLIPNLTKGNYMVTLISVFNTRVSKKINLKKKSTLLNFTGLSALYHKKSDTTNLSETLKLNDTLYIIYSTTKNEVRNEKIGITKTKTGFTALLYEGLTNTVFTYMQCPPALYHFVNDFETSIKNKNSPKAETAAQKEVFTIELNKEISSFIVPGYNNGLDRLKAVLFAVQR